MVEHDAEYSRDYFDGSFVKTQSIAMIQASTRPCQLSIKSSGYSIRMAEEIE